MVSVGANAKLNEFSAAMGLCNLRRMNQELKDRKRVSDRYRENLESVSALILNDFDRVEEKRNYAYFPIFCQEEEGLFRDNVYHVLRENQIYTRKYFYPLTCEQACFRNKYKKADLSAARRLAGQVLTLPVYGDLSNDEIDRICNIIKNTLK